ncbi:MAG: hypothetical protein GC191_00905 [Azospirillum sp.]|nr:hypothetical protein [Azospirillum sp.]
MSKHLGVAVGIVQSLEDPEGQGRIAVDIPSLPGRSTTSFAPIATLMAGPDRGTYFMPELGDEVLLAFEAGDPERPYVIGFLWNGQDKPPSSHPRERMIKSLNGHVIRLMDETSGGGAGAIVIEDANGNVISMSNGKIRIQATALLEIDAPTIVFSGPGWRRVMSPFNGSTI